MRVMGIDPDLHHAGVAIVSRSPPDAQKQYLVEWVGVALSPRHLKGYEAAINLQWPQLPNPDPFTLAPHPDRLVVEGQRIYPHSRARPEDIMRLAFAAGCAVERYQRWIRSTWIVEPAQWKGTIPDEIMRNRTLARIATTLDFKQGALLTGTHRNHVIAAIGLAIFGLEDLNRLKASTSPPEQRSAPRGRRSLPS